MLPPVLMFAPVMLPVAVISPPVIKLLPVMLPDALTKPVTYCPVEANTATFDVPLTVILAAAVTNGVKEIVADALILFDKSSFILNIQDRRVINNTK
jgi:hypothetical protein